MSNLRTKTIDDITIKYNNEGRMIDIVRQITECLKSQIGPNFNKHHLSAFAEEIECAFLSEKDIQIMTENTQDQMSKLILRIYISNEVDNYLTENNIDINNCAEDKISEIINFIKGEIFK